MRNDAASILIVEHEPLVCNLLLTLLGKKYNCTTASEAGDALELLKARRFDLVLADEGLQGCSGLAISFYVKAAAPDTLTIIISGKNDEESIEKAKRMGAYEYVCKPIDLSEVGRLIEHALSQREVNVA